MDKHPYIYPPLPEGPPPSTPPPPPPPNVPEPKQPITNHSNWNAFNVYNNQYLYTQQPPPPPPIQHFNNHFKKPHASTRNNQWHENTNHRRNNYFQPKNFNNKRRYKSNSELPSNNKKKKQAEPPLVQNYTLEDAEKAVELEKRYQEEANKQSIKITFPDSEINRDIAMGLHTDIKNVHFTKSYEPRFCFIRLHDSYDRDEVIKELNKTRFPDSSGGYLIAEKKLYDQNIPAYCINPLSLYVTHLAETVLEDDLKQIFPKSTRISIQTQKKNNSKAARIDFLSTDDSFEAFITNYSAELHMKRINVRFYNKNGSRGMPGDVRAAKVVKAVEPAVEKSPEPVVEENVDVPIKEEPFDPYVEERPASLTSLTTKNRPQITDFVVIKEEPVDYEEPESHQTVVDDFVESQSTISDIISTNSACESLNNQTVESVNNVAVSECPVTIKQELPEPERLPERIEECRSLTALGRMMRQETIDIPTIKIEPSEEDEGSLGGFSNITEVVTSSKENNEEEDTTDYNNTVYNMSPPEYEDIEEDIQYFLRNFETRKEMRRKLDAIFKS